MLRSFVSLSFLAWGILHHQLLEAHPVTQMEEHPEEIASFFEGDIILTEHQAMNNKERNVFSDRKHLWPNKTLIYLLSDEFEPMEKMWIQLAIKSLQNETCVRFQQRTSERDYLYVRKKVGCAAAVGFSAGRVEMYLNLPGCIKWGTIQHEFLHALGFWHEHTRYDRDNYITIQWQNIIKGLENNFAARQPEESWFEGLPYDFGSVMHYRDTTFSRDKSLPTIVPLKKDVKMGQRKKFSRLDVAKLNRLYECGSDFYLGEDLIATSESPPVSTQETAVESTTDSSHISSLSSDQIEISSENVIKTIESKQEAKKKYFYKNINQNFLNKLYRKKRQAYLPRQYDTNVRQYATNVHQYENKERKAHLRPPPPPVPQYWHTIPADSASCPCQHQHEPHVWCTRNPPQPSYNFERGPRQQQKTSMEPNDFESHDVNNTSAENYDYYNIDIPDNNSTQYAAAEVSKHTTGKTNILEIVRPRTRQNRTQY